MITRTYIAIGSNMGSPTENVIQAIDALTQLPNSTFIACSSLYNSKPMGDCDQATYVNAVAAIDTTLHPLRLLEGTQGIELAFGRERNGERWGPRTLDLDILLYGNLEMESERLTIPHYGMKSREFVLFPLAELVPNLLFPDGSKLTDLLTTINKNGLTMIAN